MVPDAYGIDRGRVIPRRSYNRVLGNLFQKVGKISSLWRFAKLPPLYSAGSSSCSLPCPQPLLCPIERKHVLCTIKIRIDSISLRYFSRLDSVPPTRTSLSHNDWRCRLQHGALKCLCLLLAQWQKAYKLSFIILSNSHTYHYYFLSPEVGMSGWYSHDNFTLMPDNWCRSAFLPCLNEADIMLKSAKTIGVVEIRSSRTSHRTFHSSSSKNKNKNCDNNNSNI